MGRIGRLAAGLLAAGAALLLAPAAQAARIEGQVIRHNGDKLGGPFPILLFTFDQSGWRQANETKTDGDGRFAFEDLQNPGFYWVSLRNEGVMYPGRVIELGQQEMQQTKSVNLAVYEHSKEASDVEMSAMEVSIDPEDAGVYRVTHEMFLENAKPVVIDRNPEAGPLVRVGLPAKHEQVRARLFPFLPLEFADKGGEIEIYGPIFPSQQVAEVEYAINGTPRGLETEIVIAQPVARLTLLLPPAQFAFDVIGLHSGPVDRDPQSGSIRHQTFLGFDLPAGTRIPVRLIARSAPQPPSTAAMVLMVTALFGVAAFAVLQPVLAGAKSGGIPRASRPAAGENEALFNALRDLEDDYELGKVSLEDRDRMREELRSEALRNMEQSRRAKEAAKSSARRAATRCSCGQEAQPGARFCSACGRPIA